MVTNILAAVVVTLVTNVTERVTQHWETSNQLAIYGVAPPSDRYDPTPRLVQHGDFAYMEYGVNVDDADPSYKWVRTTVTKGVSLRFKFEGRNYTQEVLRTNVLDFEVEYQAQPLRPLPPPEKNWVPVATNSTIVINNHVWVGTNVTVWTNAMNKEPSERPDR